MPSDRDSEDGWVVVHELSLSCDQHRQILLKCKRMLKDFNQNLRCVGLSYICMPLPQNQRVMLCQHKPTPTLPQPSKLSQDAATLLTATANRIRFCRKQTAMICGSARLAMRESIGCTKSDKLNLAQEGAAENCKHQVQTCSQHKTKHSPRRAGRTPAQSMKLAHWSSTSPLSRSPRRFDQSNRAAARFPSHKVGPGVEKGCYFDWIVRRFIRIIHY